MSESFQSFGSNFRVVYSSVLAFSTTVMLGTSAISLRYGGSTPFIVEATFILMLTAFSLAITMSLFVMLKGLKAKKEEGASSNSLDQRTINRSKYKGLQKASVFAIVGFIFAAIHISLLNFNS